MRERPAVHWAVLAQEPAASLWQQPGRDTRQHTRSSHTASTASPSPGRWATGSLNTQTNHHPFFFFLPTPRRCLCIHSVILMSFETDGEQAARCVWCQSASWEFNLVKVALSTAEQSRADGGFWSVLVFISRLHEGEIFTWFTFLIYADNKQDD